MKETGSEIRRQQEYIYSLQSKIEKLRTDLALTLDIDKITSQRKDDDVLKIERELNNLSELVAQVALNFDQTHVEKIRKIADRILPVAEAYVSGRHVDSEKYLLDFEKRTERAPLPANDLDPSWYSAEEIGLANDLLSFETGRIFGNGDELSSLIITDLRDIAQKDKNLAEFNKVQEAVEIVQDFLSRTEVVSEFVLREKKNSGSDVLSAGSEKIDLIWLKKNHPEVWQAILIIVKADEKGEWLRTVAGQPRNFADFYEVDEPSQTITEREVAEMLPNIIALAVANSRDNIKNDTLNKDLKGSEEEALQELYGESALSEIEVERADDLAWDKIIDRIAKELTADQSKLWREISDIIGKRKFSKLLEYERLDDALRVWSREVGKLEEGEKEIMVKGITQFISKALKGPTMLTQLKTTVVAGFRRAFVDAVPIFKKKRIEKINDYRNEPYEKFGDVLISLLTYAHTFVRDEIKKIQKESENNEQKFTPHPEYLRNLELALVEAYSKSNGVNEDFDKELMGNKLNDFSGFDLRDIDKKGPLKLRGAIMKDADFGESKLVKRGLSGIDLRGAHLRYVDFEGSFFGLYPSEDKERIPTWIIYGIVRGDIFSQKNLFKHIESSSVDGSLDLEGANLYGWEADDLQLNKENLRGSNLRGIKFTRSSLRDSDLEKADLRNAEFINVRFYRCNLQGADLRGIKLVDVQFHDVDFEGARFDKDDEVVARIFGDHLDENGIYKKDIKKPKA